MVLGDKLTANCRSINKYIHPDGVQSCQLVMGVTRLEQGSVWNTMPTHTHQRRMEAYFYFDVADDQRVFHLMGAAGRFGPHRFVRWMIRDQQATRASLGSILRWDFDRVILAHGDVVETGGRQKLRDAFGFILGAASRMQ